LRPAIFIWRRRRAAWFRRRLSQCFAFRRDILSRIPIPNKKQPIFYLELELMDTQAVRFLRAAWF
jgi:hypothetical protein